MNDFDELRRKFDRPRVAPPPVRPPDPEATPPAVRPKRQPDPSGMDPVVIRVGADLRVAMASLPPEVLADIERRLTFRNPLHRAMVRAGKTIPPRVTRYLRAYRRQGEELVVARGWAGQLMRVLQAHHLAGAYDDQTVSGPAATPLAFRGRLYGYQVAMVEDCIKKRFGILTGPIGCGKKVAAIYLMARLRMPALVVVQYRWQLHQWATLAAQFLKDGDRMTGMVGGGSMETRLPLVIGTNKSLYRVIDTLAARIGFMVVDRADDAPFSVYFKIVSKIPSSRMLGLAQKGKREDGLTQLMQAYMGPILHNADIARVRQERRFQPPALKIHETDFDYDYREDFADMISAVAKDDARNRQLVSDILAETADTGARALVICERRGHMDTLKALLADNYREAVAISARTGQGAVDEALERFDKKALQVILITARSIHRIASERIDRLIMASPVANAGWVAQAVGKILWARRRDPGRIVDYEDRPAVLKGALKKRLKVYGGFDVKREP